ncbi:MAG TPA: hypothetical protein VGD40_20185, partial [Chryseosolibacter sp.]
METKIKHEFSVLEKLLTESVRTGTNGSRNTTKRKLINEISRLKDVLVLQQLNFEDGQLLTSYVRLHQRRLFTLISTHASTKTKNENEYISLMFDLLLFLKDKFPNQFDSDSPMPAAIVMDIQQNRASTCGELKIVLDKCKISKELADALLSGVKAGDESREIDNITFRQFDLFESVKGICYRVSEQGMSEDRLHAYMIGVNYNTLTVYQYFINHYTQIITQAGSLAERIEKLSFELKAINQPSTYRAIGFDVKAPSLKSQLQIYLSEELEHHQRLRALNVKTNGEEGSLEDFRLKFDISVAQLAYLAKVLMGSKVILNDNVTQVLQFLARHSTTKRSEAISYGSIRG